MSKKMLASYASLGAAALALIFVLTGTFAKIQDVLTLTFSYFDLTFGKSLTFFGESIDVTKFSFMNLIPLLFLLGGITLLVLKLFVEQYKENRNFMFIAAVLIGAAGIFFMFSIEFAVPAQADADFSELSLGTGAIFAFILSCASAGAAIASETTLIDK